MIINKPFFDIPIKTHKEYLEKISKKEKNQSPEKFIPIFDEALHIKNMNLFRKNKVKTDKE